jgi:hypothetical protein
LYSIFFPLDKYLFRGYNKLGGNDMNPIEIKRRVLERIALNDVAVRITLTHVAYEQGWYIPEVN